MDFDYTVPTDKSFDEAVANIVSETENAGFRVLHIHDVKETLAKKNFSIEPFKIVEICNARNAYTVLQKNIRIGLFLPCKISVYQKDGRQYISGMRPSLIKELFPDSGLDETISEVEKAMKTIIDRSK